MTSRLRRLVACLALVAVGAAVPFGAALAAPTDSKPGDVRVTFAKAGTTLRASGAATGAPVGTPLPAGTACTVVEVKLPWLRVRTPAGADGWVRAFETVEPSALQPSPQPPYVAGVGAGTVTAREATAAGRQFSEDTERGYRVSRPDLQAAYAAVDAMERATQAMDPYDAISFIVDGNLGRRGRDYERPVRTPPDPEESGEPMDLGKAGDLLDKVDDLPGPLGKLFGGKKPKGTGDVVKGLRIAGAAAQAKRALDKMSERFNPTQEYYIGRAVAAQAIAKFGIDPDPARRQYVRLVGDAIVRLSERAGANHGGYHFDVLNSMEVNAVSGPGGFVLITRGAVEAAKDEEELAGFIAHELAHVTLHHGTEMIRSGPQFQQGRKEFLDALAKGLNATGVAPRMVGFFSNTIGEFSGRALGHDYGPAFERAADLEGTYLLYDVLYRASAIRDELIRLGQTGQIHGGPGHEPPYVRAQILDGVLPQLPAPPGAVEAEAPRTERFAVALRRLVARPPTPPAPPMTPPGSGMPPPPPPPIPLPPK